MPNIDISSNFRGGRGGKRHERARGGLEPRREEPADRLARAEYEELKARTPDMTVSFEEWYGFREHERNRTVQGFSALPDITAASHKKILDTPADDARANADPAWDAVIAGGTAWRGKTQDDWVRTLMLEHRSGVPAPLMDSVSEALDAARIRVSITDDYETFSELDARTLRWLSAHNDNMKIARDDARALDGVTAALRGLDAALDFIPENGPITAYAKAISPERPASAALDIRGGLSDVLMSWSHGNLKKSRDGDLVLFEAINLIEAYVRAQAATPRLPGIPMPPATLSGSPRIPNAEALYPDDQAEARAAWKPAPMDPENSTAASGAIKDAIREMPAYRGIQTGYNLVMSGLASLYRRMFLDDSWDGGWDLNADLLGSWTEMKRETARRKAGLWYAAAKKTDPGPYLLPPEGTWARFGHEALRSSIYPVASAAEFMLTAAVTKNILAPSLEAVDAFADASQAARYAADMSRFANAAAFAYGTWNGIDGEAAAQAGAVFERGIEDGMSYAEARAAEVSTYWRNAAVLSLSDPLQNALTFGLVNPFARMLGESRAARGAAWALEHGMSGLFEGGEEWFQAEIDNAALGLPRDERRMWKEFGMGAAMGLIYSSVGAGARRLADSRARVNRSKADGALLDILIAAAEATKTAKRIPEALDDFVAQASEGKLEDLWIDGDVLYGFAQSAGVKSHEELADVLGVPDDYREEFTEMLKTGSDVRASASALVSRMAADPEKYKEIRRHLKFNPSDMSLDEAEKAEKSLSADEKAAAAAMRNAVHEAEEHGDRFADFVRDMKEQFQAVSRPDLFGPKGGKGEAYAAIHAAFLATKAERMGLSREELFRPGALRVTRGASGDVKVLLERDTGPVVIEEHPAYAQAMYRNSRSLDDFFDYAVNTPKPKKKSFVTVDTPGGVALDIPDDTIRHDFSDRHRIVAEDWRSVVDNIDLPDKYALGTINNDDTYPIFLKIATDTGKYGAVIDHSQTGRNIIRTVFKGTDESIDDWIKKAEAVKPDVTPAPEDVSANSQHSHSAQAEARRLAVTPAKGNEFLTGHSSLTDILQDLQNEIKRGEDETYYQGAYHGTPYRGIERMSLEKIGTGEGAQAYGWGIYSAEARGTAESYREMLSEPSQIKSFSFGDITLFRNGEVVNYSPRTTKTRDIVRAALIENILIDEHPLRDAYEADGIEGAKRFVREKIQREIDTLIEDNGIDSEYAKEGVPVLQGILKSVNRGFIFRMENPTGQLYRMEVPESDVLLDWDKPLSEQPEKVKDALKRAGDSMPDDEAHARMAEWLYGIFEDGKDIEGSALYTALESLAADDETSYDSAEGEMKAARSASLFLDSFGIPGLQYWDGASRTRGEGTHNFVVWNEDAMEIMETYHQGGADEGGDEERGRIAFTRETAVITLFESADASTLLHEMAHFYLDDMAGMARREDVSESVARDWGVIAEWLGVADIEPGGEMKPEQAKRWADAHEKFAAAFELYLMEGTAPSEELRGVFRRFKEWLAGVYRTVASVRWKDADGVYHQAEIDDDIRAVFGRMFATDAAIEEQAIMSGLVSPGMKKGGNILADEAVAAAKERLTAAVSREMTDEAVARVRDAATKQLQFVRGIVEREPVYRAILDMQADEDLRLDINEFAERWGKNSLEAVPDGVLREGGVPVDTAAAVYGYASTDDFATDLISAPPIEEEVWRRAVEHAIRAENRTTAENLPERAEEAIAEGDEALKKDLAEFILATRPELAEAAGLEFAGEGGDGFDGSDTSSEKEDAGEDRSGITQDGTTGTAPTAKSSGTSGDEGGSSLDDGRQAAFEGDAQAPIDTYDEEMAGYEAEDEAVRAARESPLSRPNLVNWIMEHGGVSLRKVREGFGSAEGGRSNEARALVDRGFKPGFFRNEGQGLDELAAAMAAEGLDVRDGDHLYALLLAKDPAKLSAYETIYQEGEAAGIARERKRVKDIRERDRERRRAEKAALREYGLTGIELLSEEEKVILNEQAKAEHDLESAERLKKNEVLREKAKAKRDLAKTTAAAAFETENFFKSKMAAITAAAQHLVGVANVKDATRRERYDEAARKYGRMAEDEWRKGNTEEFNRLKYLELLNKQAAREAVNARKGQNDALRLLRKFADRPMRQSFGVDPRYLEQIDAILERFDLRKGAKFARVEGAPVPDLNAFVNELRESGTPVFISENVMNQNYRKNWRKMTHEELMDLRDTIKSLEYVGKFRKKLLVSERNQNLEQVLADIIQRIEKYYRVSGEPVMKPGPDDTSRIKRLSDTLDDFSTSYEMIEFLMLAFDGYKELGPSHQYIFQPIRDAVTRETALMDSVFEKVHDLAMKIYGTDSPNFAEQKMEIPVPEMGTQGTPTGRKWNITRAEYIAALLNFGNEGNRQRFRDGWFRGVVGETAEETEAIREGYMRTMLSCATKQDMDFVQGLWDIAESLWPLVRQAHEILTGVPLKKVEAQELNLELKTERGTESVTYRGGYWPAMADPRYNQRAARQQEEAELLKGTINLDHMKAETRDSHRKGRAKAVHGRPLLLSLGVIDNHLTQVVHDVCLAPVLRDVNMIIKNQEFMDAVKQALGDGKNQLLNHWLRAVGANNKNNGIAKGGLDRFFDGTRAGVIMQGLGLNLSSGILQTTGYIPLAARIGPIRAVKASLRGFWSLMSSNPAQTNWLKRTVLEKSEFMREQMRGNDRDLREMTLRWQARGKGKLDAARSMMFAQFAFFQNMCNIPGWYEAYLKGMDDFGGDETKAVRYADMVIRTTQGAASIADLTRIETSGTLGRFFTMFYSWLRVQANLNKETFRRIMNEPGGGHKLALAANRFLCVMILPRLVERILRTGGPGEGETWTRYLMREAAVGTLLAPLESIPVVRDVVSGGIAKLSGGRSGGYTMTPLVNAFSSAHRLITNAAAGAADVWDDGLDAIDWGKAAREFADFGGYAFQLPVTQGMKWFDAALADARGEEEFMQGAYRILAGRPKNRKRKR